MLKEQEGGKGSLKEVRIKPSFQKKKNYEVRQWDNPFHELKENNGQHKILHLVKHT